MKTLKLLFTLFFVFAFVVAFAQTDSTTVFQTIGGTLHIPVWLVKLLLPVAGEVVLQFVAKIHNQPLFTALGLLTAFLNWLESNLPSGKIKAAKELKRQATESKRF